MQISEVTHSVFFCTCYPHSLTDLSTANPHVILAASAVVGRRAYRPTPPRRRWSVISVTSEAMDGSSRIISSVREHACMTVV